MDPARVADRTAGWLGVAFLVALLASEAALSLPDEKATAAAVAAFYTAHRAVIIVLQVVGFAACVLLAMFAWRWRAVDRTVAVSGVILAVAALAPGIVTVLVAVAADLDSPAASGRYNRLEPRGDDLLFVGVALFAVAVVVRLGRTRPWLGAVAAVTAVCCLLRLTLEALGRDRGFLDTLAPISFLVLVAALTVLAFRGYPRAQPAG
ncbi:MAG TPA: hypothetical protein VKB69_06095 [Micromonosporaceae bacterium]|nr:hypothetical protein [Micromonosporaceae bacterium]